MPYNYMSKSKIFVGISISFAVGVLVGSLYVVSEPFVFIAAAVLASLFGLVYSTGRTGFLVAILFLFFVLAGLWRVQSSKQENEFMSLFNSKQQFEARIVEDIDIRTDKQLLTVVPIGSTQRILVTTSKYDTFFYGDRVLVQGKVSEPINFSDFDYKGYLEKNGIYALMAYPKVITLKSGEGNRYIIALLKIKYWCSANIAKTLHEPESSLLLGILIGARKTLPPAVVDDFSKTGTSHIIAISGYNISIIIALLAVLAKYFGRKISFWLSLGVIISFVVMAGSSASVLRAAVMGIMLLVSFNIGRLYAVTPAICLAALCMLIINPKILVADAGFQLSFLATIGIVRLVPLLDAMTESLPNPFELKTILLTTLSAIVATVPLVMFTFGTFSVVALLVNILVLPVVPLIMFVGSGAIVPVIGYGFGFVVHFLLRYMLVVIHFFAALSYSSLTVHMSKTMFVSSYIVIIIAYYFLQKRYNSLTDMDLYAKV